MQNQMYEKARFRLMPIMALNFFTDLHGRVRTDLRAAYRRARAAMHVS